MRVNISQIKLIRLNSIELITRFYYNNKIIKVTPGVKSLPNETKTMMKLILYIIKSAPVQQSSVFGDSNYSVS